MVAVLGFGKEQIHDAVRDMYTLVARRPTAPLHFPVGPGACRLAGYDEGAFRQVPTAALEPFAGVGCPFRAGVIEPGQTVLDVGSGSGTDVAIGDVPRTLDELVPLPGVGRKTANVVLGVCFGRGGRGGGGYPRRPDQPSARLHGLPRTR